MRDSISENRVMLLHPLIRFEVKQLIEKAETKIPAAIRIVQGLRTFEEQDAIYAQGRTKPGKVVSYAKAGQSYHNYGLAIDFSLLYDKDTNGTFETLSWDILKDFDVDGESDWLEVVDIFEEAGYIWGGRFSGSKRDNPHLERHFNNTYKQLLAKYNGGWFIPNTKYVQL